jgi:hypothetical protein
MPPVAQQQNDGDRLGKAYQQVINKSVNDGIAGNPARWAYLECDQSQVTVMTIEHSLGH